MQTLELLFLRFNCQAVSLGLLNFRIRFITIRDSINKHEFIHSSVSHVKSQHIQHLVGQYYVVINEYKNKVWRAVLSWIFRARKAWWSHLQARRCSLRAC